MFKTATLLLMLCSLIACEVSKSSSNSMQKKAQDPGNFILSGHIVEKDFIKKNGEPAGFTELYFRASVQDYYIKFCESKITKNDLEPFIDQVVTVHAEIRDGNWDICENDPQEMQSRTGNYLVVLELK
ncbi:MAG: hypothetical protein JKY22_00535 [Flavobacteriaceae bacterium]|nr:hypothetical protein [Flavobacteriaceae bacterium]